MKHKFKFKKGDQVKICDKYSNFYSGTGIIIQPCDDSDDYEEYKVSINNEGGIYYYLAKELRFIIKMPKYLKEL